MTNLIELHIPYAHAIAAEFLSRFPAHVDRKDVQAAAEFGLVQAANAYDSARGVAFTTFAYYRIRGAVFDLLRQTVKASRFEEAANEYMADYSSGSPAGAAAPSYDELKNIASSVAATYFLSLENLSQEPEAQNNQAPLETLLRREQQQGIRTALQSLPEKNRQVLAAYYFEDLTLDEIGVRLGLSKSWVSRLHAKGLELLRPAVESSLKAKAGKLKGQGSALGGA